MSSTKPSIPKVGECSTPNTLEHREDNLTPLSLLSLPGDIREALQSVIVSKELDLDEIDPDQVIMPKTWILVDPIEQIGKAYSITAEDENQMMDWLTKKRGLKEPTILYLISSF